MTATWPSDYISGVTAGSSADGGLVFFDACGGHCVVGSTSDFTVKKVNAYTATYTVVVSSDMNGNTAFPIHGMTIVPYSGAPDHALATTPGTYDWTPTPPVNDMPEVPWAAALPAGLLAAGVVLRHRQSRAG